MIVKVGDVWIILRVFISLGFIIFIYENERVLKMIWVYEFFWLYVIIYVKFYIIGGVVEIKIIFLCK